jgi:hypothetical protein
LVSSLANSTEGNVNGTSPLLPITDSGDVSSEGSYVLVSPREAYTASSQTQTNTTKQPHHLHQCPLVSSRHGPLLPLDLI